MNYHLKVFKKIFKPNHSFSYFNKLLDFVFYKKKKLSAPLRLQIELSSLCNYKCDFCYHGHYKREKDFMRFEDVKKIIDDSKAKYFQFSGIGETFLHPDIKRILFYSKKDANRFVRITTNGFLMKKDISKAIVDSGIDNIDISLDTLDPKIYPKIRVGGNLETVLNNLEYLSKYKKNKKSNLIISISLIFNEKNIYSLSEQIEKIISLPVDNVDFGLVTKLFESAPEDSTIKRKNINKINKIIEDSIIKCQKRDKKNISDSLKNLKKQINYSEDKTKKRLCYLSLYSPYVMVDGTLLPCCNSSMWALEKLENKETFKMGNVIEKNFQEVWNSKRANLIRMNILKNPDKFGYCKFCSFNEYNLFSIFYKISKVF